MRVHPLAPSLIPTSQNMRHFNVVVLGAGGVGKSALTVRFVQDVFLENYDPTIEEAYRRILDIDGVQTSLEVLDTAGAEQFTALKELYIKGGQGFVLVFSLTQEASLRELDNLRQQIHRVKGMDSDVPIVVVGTKLDLVHEREVARSTIQCLVALWKIPFYETSAKRDWHINDVFQELVKQMLMHYPDEPPPKKASRRSRRRHCIVM